MANDLQALNRKKERILLSLKLRGPSLPSHIAKEIESDLIFAAAFLSELRAEGKIKISNMKVGSSPLYYLSGQESMLENFVEHLNSREKEALLLLKKEKILQDEKQEPVIRVVLRAIKDFAFPIRIRVGEESKLFWKYFSVSDEEIREIISKAISPKIEKKEELERVIKTEATEKEKKEKKIRKKETKKIEMGEFSKNVKDYLSAKDIEILAVFSEKKKEFNSKIRIDTSFGKQEFYLVAKEKKNVTENDLAVALQKAQSEKMLAVLMSNGELNNKAKSYLKEWNNLIKFEKLKF